MPVAFKKNRCRNTGEVTGECLYCKAGCNAGVNACGRCPFQQRVFGVITITFGNRCCQTHAIKQ